MLTLHPLDNVAVVVRPARAGVELRDRTGHAVVPDRDVPAGHKVALRPIAAGEPIVKYGQTIGFAREVIAPGEHVHTHNVVVRDFERQYAPGSEAAPVEPVPAERRRTFNGYLRGDGKVGTRNYVAVIS